jgi:hypothetical protein
MNKTITSIVLIFIVSCGGSSNDETINPNFAPPPSLDTFSFLKINNSNLNKDISLNLNSRLDGTEFIGRVDENIDISELISTFSYTGLDVSANNISQQSGISINNFNKIITYTVTNSNGLQKNYQIDLIK